MALLLLLYDVVLPWVTQVITPPLDRYPKLDFSTMKIM